MEIGWRPEHPRLLVCWAWSTAAKVRLSSVSSIREAGPGELEFLSLDKFGLGECVVAVPAVNHDLCLRSLDRRGGAPL